MANFEFVHNKLRVNVVGDAFPKGKGYLFSNITEQFSNDQVVSLGQAVGLLTDCKTVGYDAMTTKHMPEP